MIKEKFVDVKVNQMNCSWYREKGYELPTKQVQTYYTNKDGEKRKNGYKTRIAMGEIIRVKVEDLQPGSNVLITIICPNCRKEYSIRWGYYLKEKKSDKCQSCWQIKGDGSHGYWVEQLITNNPDAKCDISGETDKRFLVLHHLTNRKDGGRNEPDNYVILSANYHHAFHQWNGGTNVPCTKELYIQFKDEELARKK